MADIYSDDFMRKIESLAASTRDLPDNPYDIAKQGAEYLAWHKGFCAGMPSKPLRRPTPATERE